MIAPPRFTEQLLRALCPASTFRDDILGDLTEEFHNRAESENISVAVAWYRHEALRTAPHLIVHSMRDFRLRDMPSLVGRLFAAYAVGMSMGILVGLLILITTESGSLWMFPRPIDARLVTSSVTAITIGYWASAYARRTSAIVASIAAGIFTFAVTALLFAVLARGRFQLFSTAAIYIVGCTFGGILHAAILSWKAQRTS